MGRRVHKDSPREGLCDSFFHLTGACTPRKAPGGGAPCAIKEPPLGVIVRLIAVSLGPGFSLMGCLKNPRSGKVVLDREWALFVPPQDE